ncbi:MAG TPA: ATP-binding protein [Mycobacteriales bacterium]|nr:ATP-binding protein [Mycobacteriales bacterium]
MPSKPPAASVFALSRSLRGRVSAVSLAMVAAWLVILTAAFNLVLAARLDADIDSALRTRAATAAATATVDANGKMTVKEGSDDEALDSGVWFYSGRRAVERPPGNGRTQSVADSLAGRDRVYSDGGGNRLYAFPVRESGGQVGTVVTSLSVAPYHRTRDEALTGSVILAVLTLAGAYLALWVAATRALRPIDEMTLQASEWSASALTERFGPDQRFAELTILAETLNGVLDRLSASVRHEQRLIAELSHELRTPLSLVLAETDLLLARNHEPDQVRAAHRQIRRTALSMNRILETLLSAGRAQIVAGAGSCRVEPAVTELLQRRTTRRYCVDIAPDLVAGAEATIIERVLAPLVENAERYAAATVRISARRAADSVLIEVSDDGPGIPAGEQRDIFEPGMQLSGDRRGAGLGLALARRLARAAAGDVSFRGGSTFQVRFPPA